jgi:hypothetical protein
VIEERERGREGGRERRRNERFTERIEEINVLESPYFSHCQFSSSTVPHHFVV